jgi:hypothetical protein
MEVVSKDEGPKKHAEMPAYSESNLVPPEL